VTAPELSSLSAPTIDELAFSCLSLTCVPSCSPGPVATFLRKLFFWVVTVFALVALRPQPPPSMPPHPPPPSSPPIDCSPRDQLDGRTRLNGTIGQDWCHNNGIPKSATYVAADAAKCKTLYVDPIWLIDSPSSYAPDCSGGCALCEYQQAQDGFYKCLAGLRVCSLA